MYTHLENYAATGAGPQRVTKPSRMRAESDGLSRDCGSRPCTPAAGSPAILTSGGLRPLPRARGLAGAAPPGKARPPFLSLLGGGRRLAAGTKPRPSAPPPPACRVGRAGSETLGLGSVSNALKRRRAALRQRRPAERASKRTSAWDGGASGRGAGETRTQARSLLRQVPTSRGPAGRAPSRGAVRGNLRF